MAISIELRPRGWQNKFLPRKRIECTSFLASGSIPGLEEDEY